MLLEKKDFRLKKEYEDMHASIKNSLSKVTIFIWLASFSSLLSAQSVPAVSRWQNITSLHEITDIKSEGHKKLWVGTTGGFYSFDFQNGAEVFYKSEKLTHASVASLFFDASSSSLWIGSDGGYLTHYDIEKNLLLSFSDIARMREFSAKTIRGFLLSGDTLFVGTDFGIINFNPQSKTIREGYTEFGLSSPASKLMFVKLWRNLLVVVFDNSVSFAPLASNNLIASTTWRNILLPNTTSCDVFQNKLFVGTSKGVFYFNDPQSLSILSMPSFSNQNSYLAASSSHLVVITKYALHLFDTMADANQVASPDVFPIPIQQAKHAIALSNDSILLVSQTDSLFLFIRNKESHFITAPSSPFELETIASGIDSYNQIRLSGNNFSSVFSSSKMIWERDTIPFNKLLKTQSGEFFVASKKHGLFRLSPNPRFFRSDVSGSTSGDAVDVEVTDLLETGSKLWFCVARTPAVFAFDKERESITRIAIPSIPSYVYPTRLEIDNASRKWIALTDGYGARIFDDGGTLSDITDDVWLSLGDAIGTGKLSSSVIHSFARDNNGSIWIATEQGSNYFLSPEREVTKKSIGNSVSISDLAGKVLTSIAIDGEGKKWFGSQNGVWVVGSSFKVEANYTADNSPLLSNQINSISFDGERGRVLVSTDKGLSVLTTASTTPKAEMSGLEAFPNPFLIPSNEPLYIRGLSENSTVSIFTISGNRVKTLSRTSAGGSLWDGYDDMENLVCSGIYLVVALAENGSKSAIGKVAVIRQP